MELRHLRYFTAIAEEQSLTKAAARLHVAQSALSRQMQDLETELSTQLLERGKRGVRLTRGGEVFLQHARDLLSRAEQAAQDTQAATDTMAGRLALGFHSSHQLNVFRPVIEEFRAIHPKVIFDFEHGNLSGQIKMLRQGRLDLAYSHLPPEPIEGTEHLLVTRLPFCVAMPENHLFVKRQSLALRDLEHEDIVFCTRESRPEYYDQILAYCADEGFKPRIVKEIGGVPSNVTALVSLGLGVTVVPDIREAEPTPGVVWRPLREPEIFLELALYWLAGKEPRVAREFVALMEKRLAKGLKKH